MRCPKCNFDQPDDRIDCLNCGIVFAKYLSARTHMTVDRAGVPATKPSSEVDYGQDSIKTFLRDLLFYVNPEIGIFALIGRGLILAVISVWGLKFIFSSVESNYAGTSFLHLINLPFHEAGHIIFRLFGQFMTVLGGSLMQCLVPLVCLLTFLLKTRDPFASAVSLWWLGENMIDLAPYINDARALKLILLGGVTGRDVDDYHDWEFILRKLGLLQFDNLIARTAHVLGAILMILAILWGATVLFTQHRNRRTDTEDL